MREHKLTMEVEERRRTRNDIEKDTEVQIQQKNLEAEIQTPGNRKRKRICSFTTTRRYCNSTCKTKSRMLLRKSPNALKKSEQAQIAAQEEVNKAKIEQQKNLDQSPYIQ